MSSELRVDTIKLANGSAATASGLGIGGVGKIGQVVESTSISTTFINSTSFTDIGLSVSITPTSTSSKVIVMADFAYTQDDLNNESGFIQISRDSTAITNHLVGSDGAGGDLGFGCHIQKLDSPSTTSSVNYKIQARTTNSSSDFRPKGNASIIAMEVLA